MVLRNKLRTIAMSSVCGSQCS